MCTTGSKSTINYFCTGPYFGAILYLIQPFSPPRDGAKCLVGCRIRVSPLNHNMWQQGPIAHFWLGSAWPSLATTIWQWS